MVAGPHGDAPGADQQPEFDRYLNWLKYQTLAERISARRGFYQASGAYGFRDQLQDAVNLIWMDRGGPPANRPPRLAAIPRRRRGALVPSAAGRPERLRGRTHASDNLLWLPWGVVEYLAATGDESLLDERTPYLEAEQPFEPLRPASTAWGSTPCGRPADTVYRHCLKAIDLVLDRRMGSHGLPLMGTGDWNDGLDEIGSQGRARASGSASSSITSSTGWSGSSASGTARPARNANSRRLAALKDALERTWGDDRYLRAFHDDGTEIGVKGSGDWEIDA